MALQDHSSIKLVQFWGKSPLCILPPWCWVLSQLSWNDLKGYLDVGCDPIPDCLTGPVTTWDGDRSEVWTGIWIVHTHKTLHIFSDTTSWSFPIGYRFPCVCRSWVTWQSPFIAKFVKLLNRHSFCHDTPIMINNYKLSLISQPVSFLNVDVVCSAIFLFNSICVPKFLPGV